MTSVAALPFQRGSGVRIWRGKSGRLFHRKGELWLGRAPKVGIDSHLAVDLEAIADALGLRIWVNSVDTGSHAVGSRHWRGLAADVDRLTRAGADWHPVTIDNHDARVLARFLHEQGWRHYEDGPWPCVLLGPPYSEFNKTSASHADHLHISLWR